LELVEQLVRRRFAGMEPTRIDELVKGLKADMEKRLAEAEAMKAKADAAADEPGNNDSESKANGRPSMPMPPGAPPA